jgi:hypothetical protein
MEKKNKCGRFGTVSSGSGQKWLAFLNGTFGSDKRQVVSSKSE